MFFLGDNRQRWIPNGYSLLNIIGTSVSGEMVSEHTSALYVLQNTLHFPHVLN